MNYGIYVHIPFCARKCPYCDFYSCRGNREIQHQYVRCLLQEIQQAPDVQADTLYLGGGTPSLLLPEELAKITRLCSDKFHLKGEITLEANPGTVQPHSLEKLREAGFNRISFGVQSFVPEELQYLGRLHSAEQARESILNAKAAGFDNISADLMLGIPGQTLSGIRKSMDILSALPVTHLSAYMLKIEEHTPFNCRKILDLLPDEDLVCDSYKECISLASSMGLEQYEISNFAKSGYESRHNLKYWERAPYLAFGPAAYGFYEGNRYKHNPDLSAYLSGNYGIQIDEIHPDPLEEELLLGLRLKKGISFQTLADRYHFDWNQIKSFLNKLCSAGLMQKSENGFGFTTDGFLVSNTLIAEWMNFFEQIR